MNYFFIYSYIDIKYEFIELMDPENFMIDEEIIESSSFYISWDTVENITHYQLDVKKTVAVNEKKRFKLNGESKVEPALK